MLARRSLALFSVVVALALLLGNGQSVVAQPSDPPAGALPPWGDPTTLPPWQLEAGGKPYQNAEGLWAMPAAAERGPQSAPDAAPLSTGGPDDFGYTWDDNVPMNWIDASGGTDTGINANVDHVGPADIGFPFKYYENVYNQLYISRFGFVAFGGNNLSNTQSQVPSAEIPNDVIAPHWVPAHRLDGYVRYLRGAALPIVGLWWNGNI